MTDTPPPHPPGSYVITPQIMWQTVEEARAAARNSEAASNRLADKLDPALYQIRKDITDLDEREKDHHNVHGKDIEALKQQSWSSRWVPALVTALLVAIISGVAVVVIVNALQR